MQHLHGKVNVGWNAYVDLFEFIGTILFRQAFMQNIKLQIIRENGAMSSPSPLPSPLPHRSALTLNIFPPKVPLISYSIYV